MTQRHFVDVWNPSYASNSMEAHLAILLGAVKHFDVGQLESDDDIYVWWGKVRSPNRRQQLGSSTRCSRSAPSSKADGAAKGTST